MIALFLGIIGFYYLLALFGNASEENNLQILNGAFLGAIALGIMWLNYRNFSLYSEQREDPFGAESRYTGQEVAEVAEVEVVHDDIATETRVQKIDRPTQIEPEKLGCPKCGETITITVTQRPLKIKCPYCGVEGLIR